MEKTENNKVIESLVKAQLEIVPPEKDKINPRFKSKYCSLDSIYSACRVPMARNGLTLSHSVESIEGKSVLVTKLTHISGQSIENKIPMFVDNQTSQGFASALTYSRRYAVCSLIGLPTDDDDDGELATREEEKPKFVGMNPDQICHIINVVGNDEPLLERVLKGYGVTDLRAIASSEYDRIMHNLKKIKAPK